MTSTFQSDPTTYSSLWKSLLDDATFHTTFTNCMKHNIESPASRAFLKNLPGLLCNDNTLFVKVIADTYLLPRNVRDILYYSQSTHIFTFWRLIFTVAIFILLLIGIFIQLLMP